MLAKEIPFRSGSGNSTPEAAQSQSDSWWNGREPARQPAGFTPHLGVGLGGIQGSDLKANIGQRACADEQAIPRRAEPRRFLENDPYSWYPNSWYPKATAQINNQTGQIPGPQTVQQECCSESSWLTPEQILG